MGVLDWILVIIRWGHALAAVSWVGGGVFYLMVLRPAIRRSQGLPPNTGAAIRDEFRGLVTTAIAVLLLTGAILSLARLTSEAATIPYTAVLVVKIVLALFMFCVVRYIRRGDYGRAAGHRRQFDSARLPPPHQPGSTAGCRIRGDWVVRRAGRAV